eukprot:TRINITY_DN5290_c0_g1_i2.p1 TRINITY_DN5290_c0_g1~~TRINITY_DN5290_c0_g1_i2.p1  ORF type:complete len:160 (+),score=37.37 TRINITY_DN5290_c0_g1_i2:111-590(+)
MVKLVVLVFVFLFVQLVSSQTCNLDTGFAVNCQTIGSTTIFGSALQKNAASDNVGHYGEGYSSGTFTSTFDYTQYDPAAPGYVLTLFVNDVANSQSQVWTLPLQGSVGSVLFTNSINCSPIAVFASCTNGIPLISGSTSSVTVTNEFTCTVSNNEILAR